MRRSPDPDGVRAECEVRLWERTVGAIVELEGGRILFEYADAFRRSGLQISPLHLPLELRGPVAFPELRRTTFEGLPGVFADALPDAFGRAVIRQYYAARGDEERAMSPVQRLLYVGERAIGALTFHPVTELPDRVLEREALDVQALAHDARRVIQGDPAVAVPEIYRIGSSAGGQRPKAVVLWNPESRTVTAGTDTSHPEEISCILKFDGATETDSPGATGARSASGLARPQPFNRVEAAYREMAAAAGIEMPPIDVLEIDGYAHLLIHRFDRVDGERIHQHTFGGLIQVDYNNPGASSYEEYFRTILRLGMAYDALRQAYHRMVFNVLAVNQDDHVKNLSFHMDREGVWSLAPAYDVTFAHGSGWTRAHQMRIRDKVTEITVEDLLEVGREFGVKKPERVVERTREALGRWPEVAAEFGVPEEVVATIAGELGKRDRL